MLSSRILGFPRCEVLIYLPTPHSSPAVGKPTSLMRFTKLYGDRRMARQRFR